MKDAPRFSLYMGTRYWSAEVHLPPRKPCRWWFKSDYGDGVRYCLLGMASLIVVRTQAEVA